MIALVRWVSVALAASIIVALGQVGEPSLVTAALAVLLLVAFLAVCWSFGAFRADAWIGDEPADAPASRLDVLDGRGNRGSTARSSLESERG